MTTQQQTQQPPPLDKRAPCPFCDGRGIHRCPGGEIVIDGGTRMRVLPGLVDAADL